MFLEDVYQFHSKSIVEDMCMIFFLWGVYMLSPNSTLPCVFSLYSSMSRFSEKSFERIGENVEGRFSLFYVHSPTVVGKFLLVF